METIFELQNVAYTYLGKFEALKDVNLTMTAGEQIVVVGANGSGKSTLLSILAALNFPTAGKFSAASIERRVDFPLPFAPTTTICAPAVIVKFTSLSASNFPK